MDILWTSQASKFLLSLSMVLVPSFQLTYVTIFLVYATRDKKIKTARLVAILNVGFLGAVIAVTILAMHGGLRTTFVGVLCAALTIGMYAAPLSAMKLVIQTRSVEYMPFFLSFFLFLNGGVWSVYALLVKDYYIGVPNAFRFCAGVGPVDPLHGLQEEGSSHDRRKRLRPHRGERWRRDHAGEG
ncbi:hypothetical protein OIU84_018101 [Salix udensis]|uniref:Bidirectional sugar transporter SWEET n=1 Tax=Salix udensis TaxID=889485 RepID=A0AAD6PL92_9ROSI|nr:hypothetical protein OIU84_018101 [Salix udensis]